MLLLEPDPDEYRVPGSIPNPDWNELFIADPDPEKLSNFGLKSKLESEFNSKPVRYIDRED